MARWMPTVLLGAAVVAAARALGAAATADLNGTTLRMATPREVAGYVWSWPCIKPSGGETRRRKGTGWG